MSKTANLYLFLSGILKNHSITSLVSFHWLNLRQSLNWWFILSRMFLLIQPISFFAELISLTIGLFLKFGLWSFNVMKHSFLPFVNIWFNISFSFMSFFQPRLSCYEYYRLPFCRLLLSSRLAFSGIALFLIYTGWMSHLQRLMLHLCY